jgi:hypothetical protein
MNKLQGGSETYKAIWLIMTIKASCTAILGKWCIYNTGYILPKHAYFSKHSQAVFTTAEDLLLQDTVQLCSVEIHVSTP